MFLENHACYMMIEGKINGRTAIMMCYDFFHTSTDVIGYTIKNTMLSLEPEGTMVIRPATPNEIEEWTSDPDGNKTESRYKIVCQAEAHRIFKEKTDSSSALDDNGYTSIKKAAGRVSPAATSFYHSSPS